MAYIHNIIGKSEKLHGIARLHWIYLLRGLIGFLFFVGIGLALDMAIFRALTALEEVANGITGTMLLSVNSVITPVAVICGGFYFLFFLIKVLFTEVGLTEKRIILKTGLLFIKIKEIDIQEISGEDMDMGYFGAILGYGYVRLDCRFVGDIRLPAIANANNFIKALHAARMRVTAIYPDDPRTDSQAAATAPMDVRPVSVDDKLQNEMLKPLELKPDEKEPRETEILAHGMAQEAAIEEKSANATAEAATAVVDKEKELLQLQIAKLELEVKLREAENAEATSEPTKEDTQKNDYQNRMAPTPPTAPPPPPASAGAAIIPTAPVKDAATAQSVMPEMAKMPQVTDNVAAELIASGLIPHPDEIKPEPKFEEERARPAPPSDEQRLEPTNADPLINDFATSATVVNSSDNGELKPAPAM